MRRLFGQVYIKLPPRLGPKRAKKDPGFLRGLLGDTLAQVLTYQRITISIAVAIRPLRLCKYAADRVAGWPSLFGYFGDGVVEGCVFIACRCTPSVG
jgi:hypothetical protein